MAETLATPQKLLEVCRELQPLVAILSGGEPLMRHDLLEIVRTLKAGCAPLRVFLNTNGALLTRTRFDGLVDAGVDEVLVSLDYPDARHDGFRTIPGLFDRIRALLAELPPGSGGAWSSPPSFTPRTSGRRWPSPASPSTGA